MRKNISTNTPSERSIGYSRAVIINKRMYFSGTTSIDEAGKTVGETAYEQTKYCFEKIEKVLRANGFSKNEIVLVTAYLVDMGNLREFDRTFQEYLFDVKPCCTLVGIKELVKPDLLVEIACIAEKS